MRRCAVLTCHQATHLRRHLGSGAPSAGRPPQRAERQQQVPERLQQARLLGACNAAHEPALSIVRERQHPHTVLSGLEMLLFYDMAICCCIHCPSIQLSSEPSSRTAPVGPVTAM